MISADPMDSLMAMIPVGETKIPEPIIDPTTIDIPPRTDIFRLSSTPFFFFDEPRDAKLSLCKRFFNHHFTKQKTVFGPKEANHGGLLIMERFLSDVSVAISNSLALKT